MNEQAQQADDPSGEGWRDVGPDEPIEQGDVFIDPGGGWMESDAIGRTPSKFPNLRHRRRIEQQQPSDSEPETMEGLQERLNAVLKSNDGLEHDIQRQYELLRAANERNEKLVRQVELTQQENGELLGLVSQAERSGEQVNAELQQLRKELMTSQHLAEMSRRQVADEAGKIEQLKEQVQALTRERDRYRNQLAGAIEHSSAAAGQQQVLEALQAWLRPVLELVAEHPEDASPLAVAVLGYLPGIVSRLIEE